MRKIEDSRLVYVPIIVGGFLAFVFLNILNSSYSTVLELIKKDLSLTYTMSGALMSSYFVGYMLGQIPWGMLADRFGSRRVIATSICGAAMSSLFFSIASSFWPTIAARFLAGLLGAGVFVPTVKLVSEWFIPERRGTALGILSIGGSLGLIISSGVIPVATVQLGWRHTLSLAGVAGVAAAAVIWLTLRDPPSASRAQESPLDLVSVVRTRDFWVLAWTQVVRLGANYTYIAWLPLILREEYGLSLVAAGAVFSLFNLAGMISNPVGGIASDWIGEWIVLLTTFIGLGAVTYLFIAFQSSVLLYLGVVALGWGINFIRSPHFAIIPKLYGIERAGQIAGVLNTFAAAGALCLPLVLGAIRDSTASYFAGWALLAFTIVSAGVLLLALKIRN